MDAVYTDSANFAQYASRRGQALRSGITVVDNATGAVVALAGRRRGEGGQPDLELCH